MRLDAHQHFWNYDPKLYAWINEDMGVLRHDFGPAELAPHLDAHGLDGSIAVQARQDLDETRWLVGLKREHPRVLGVVGWLDLRAEDLSAQLDEFASDLCGVRHVVQDEPDERFLLREDFRAGVRRLAEPGLTYDVLIYPNQLPAAVEFCAGHDDLRLVLDHIAKPYVKRGEIEPWATHIRELARNPHVACKVSGMVTEADWQQWKPSDLHPYLDVVLEAFGPQRLMFGSDWPVCLLASEYGPMQEVVSTYFAELTQAEQERLWGGTAKEWYDL